MPDNTLQFVPVEELMALRSGKQEYFDICLHSTPFSITAGDGVAFECKMILDLQETTASRIWLKLRSNEERETQVCFDLQKAELSFDRNNSDGWSSGCSASPLDLKGRKLLDIHFFPIRVLLSCLAAGIRTTILVMCLQTAAKTGIILWQKEVLQYLRALSRGAWKRQWHERLEDGPGALVCGRSNRRLQ